MEFSLSRRHAVPSMGGPVAIGPSPRKFHGARSAARGKRQKVGLFRIRTLQGVTSMVGSRRFACLPVSRYVRHAFPTTQKVAGQICLS